MRFTIETAFTEGLVTSTTSSSRATLKEARDWYESIRAANAAKLRGLADLPQHRNLAGIVETSLTDKLTGDEYAYLLMVRRPSGDLYYVEGPDRNTAYVRFLSWSLPSTPNLPEEIDPSVRTNPHTKDAPPDVWDMPVYGDVHRIRVIDLMDGGKVREWVFPDRAEAIEKWDYLTEIPSSRYRFVMAYKQPDGDNWVTIRNA